MQAFYGSQADECFFATRLFLKLDLALERDTVLHFFDQIRKVFPAMRRFQRRENGTLILEEAPDSGAARRWVRLDPGSLRFGHYSPQASDDIRRLGETVLELAPYHLTLSELDFDHLEVSCGFDLDYRGNHDQLLAEVFWADHPLGAFLFGEDARDVIDAQPYLGVTLTPACDLQAYIEVKSRTGTYEVRTGNYEIQPLNVMLTIRKYWGVGEDQPLVETHRRMCDECDNLASTKLVPLVINPLAQAIASRS